MGNNFVDYPHSLNQLKVADLTQMRENIITNMALKVVNHQKVRKCLPLRKEISFIGEDTQRNIK